MGDWLFWGAIAGVVAPVLLLAVVAVVTVVEWPVLRQLGWSARRRNDVGWPSILALGQIGWTIAVAFVVCGILGLAFAATLHRVLPGLGARVGALVIGLAAAALGLVSFRADPPGTAVTSWHARIHDGAYPLIPVGSIAAAALLAWSLWDQPRWSGQARLALAALLVIVPAFILTGVNSVGQLARYVLFAALLLWLELLALATMSVIRVTRGS
jgi:hypothetical protein